VLDDSRWGEDPRGRDDNSRDLSRGSRGGSDPRDRERVDPRDVFTLPKPLIVQLRTPCVGCDEQEKRLHSLTAPVLCMV
jgi:hypothetical protein